VHFDSEQLGGNGLHRSAETSIDREKRDAIDAETDTRVWRNDKLVTPRHLVSSTVGLILFVFRLKNYFKLSLRATFSDTFDNL